MVTMADVARQAGVSPATVSRVVNGNVSVEIRKQVAVEDAITLLNYRPNAIARGLARRSSRTVGIVINTFASLYFGSMLDGVVDGLAEVGYTSLVEPSRERAEGEREAWLSLAARQCDAIVVHSDNLGDAELADWLRRHDRSVLMNRRLAGFESRCVYLDNVRGGRLAAEHLIARGHRTIATVAGPERFYEVRDRMAGFTAALLRAGVPLDMRLTAEGDFTADGGRAATEALLARGLPFSAIFFHSDEMAAGGMEACRAAGLAVPVDVSMIGFDDIAMARHLGTGLTTIRQPLEEIGRSAGRLAHSLATEMPAGATIQRAFAAELIERASVRDMRK